jgi:UDP-3-O-[3-hydroxymyristoyl] glucosamine N-acyltransferase
MSDLTNSLINATYKKLIQVSSSGNEGISGTLTNVQTGDGTNTALKLATSAAQVDGTLFVGQTFGVSGDASVAGDLAVANKVCASAYYGDGSNLTGLTFSGDVSVSSLIVTNNVTVGGNVTIGGNIMVSGGEIQVKNTGTQSNIKLYCESSNAHYAALQAPPHSSFSGNITITLPTSAATLVGTSTTDTLTNKTFGDKVDFNSDVCISGDSVLVGSATIGGTLSVGGAVNMLSTATVSGTAGFLGAVRVSGNTSVGGTLDVAGNVSLGGNVTVKGNVHVSSKVCASAFYGDGTNITGIPISGNISVADAIVGGTLKVSGATSLEDAVVMKSTVTVIGAAHLQGATSLGSTLKVLGATTITGNTGFLGTVRVSGATSIEGAAVLKSTLTVVGATHLQSTLSVAGNGTFAEKVCASAFFGDGANLTNVPAVITGNISVNNATIGGNLFVGGTATIVGNTTMTANLGVGGTLDVVSNTSIGGTAKITGTTTITGNSGFLGTVRVSGATSLGSTLAVAGNTSLGGTVTITGNVMVSSGLIAVKNGGSQSEVRLYCESGNAHYAALQAPAHSAFSGNITLTLPAVTDTIAGIAATQTFTNKTFGDKVEFDNDVCVSGNVHIGGTTTITGAAVLKAAVSMGSTLKVTGATTITGATGVLGSMRVSGATSLEGTLKVLGGAAAAVCATAINGVTSVALNFATAQNFTTTVTAAHTLAKPTNCVTGQTGSILLTQSGGSGTMAYNADFKFIGGTDPTMSAANGAVDRLDYIIVSASSDGVGGDIQMIISQAYA